MKACEELEAKMEHMQIQLQDIERLQKGLGYAQDALSQRLEVLETPGLRPIAEEQADSPGGRTADSAKLVPQSSAPRTLLRPGSSGRNVERAAPTHKQC